MKEVKKTGTTDALKKDSKEDDKEVKGKGTTRKKYYRKSV